MFAIFQCNLEFGCFSNNNERHVKMYRRYLFGDLLIVSRLVNGNNVQTGFVVAKLIAQSQVNTGTQVFRY